MEYRPEKLSNVPISGREGGGGGVRTKYMYIDGGLGRGCRGPCCGPGDRPCFCFM